MALQPTLDNGESCAHGCETVQLAAQDSPPGMPQPASPPKTAEEQPAPPKDDDSLPVLPIPRSRRADAFLQEWLRRSNRG